MTDRTRSTTLRLRLPPTSPVGPGTGPSAGAAAPRPGPGPETQRFAPRSVVMPPPSRHLEPHSKAIIQELAALGLADAEETP